MKTTIYELLGMIKDGKAPKKIMYKEHILKFNEDDMDYFENDEDGGYIAWLFSSYRTDYLLNEEVTILETTITYKQDLNNCKQDDKIEYLGDFYKDDRFGYSIDLGKVRDKINEIIDYLNNK